MTGREIISLCAYRAQRLAQPQLANESGHSFCDAAINLGQELAEAGESVMAEKLFRVALSFVPDDAVATFNLGVVMQDRGRFKAAKRYYRVALKAGINDAAYNLATVYDREGNRRMALRYLTEYRTKESAQ